MQYLGNDSPLVFLDFFKKSNQFQKEFANRAGKAFFPYQLFVLKICALSKHVTVSQTDM